jgi:hypothetical protein
MPQISPAGGEFDGSGRRFRRDQCDPQQLLQWQFAASGGTLLTYKDAQSGKDCDSVKGKSLQTR